MSSKAKGLKIFYLFFSIDRIDHVDHYCATSKIVNSSSFENAVWILSCWYVCKEAATNKLLEVTTIPARIWITQNINNYH